MLAAARGHYTKMMQAINSARTYASEQGEEYLHSLTHRMKEHLDKLATFIQVYFIIAVVLCRSTILLYGDLMVNLKENHDTVTDNKVRLQQFHSLEADVQAAYARVKDKFEEPTHIIFGASTKPSSITVTVCSYLQYQDRF